MDTVIGILLILLFIFVLGGVLLFVTEPRFLHKILVMMERDQFSNIQNQTHWTHMPLTYRIDLNESEISYVEIALQGIHQLVPNLSFVRMSGENPDILFLSNKNISEGEYLNVRTIGSAYINYSANGEYITHAGVYIPTSQTKLYSNINVETHEILHSFGFNHINKTEDIMYIYLSQDIYSLDEYYSCLNYIYSNGHINGSCENVEMNTKTW